MVSSHSNGNRTRHWYVVYSKPHKEEQARFHLQKKHLDVFFPRLCLPGGAAKRRIVPLFPNYLFVRIHLMTEYHHVAWTPGVRRMVCFNDEPVPLDERVVEFLMQQGGSQGLIMARSTLERGQIVEINDGPFAGLFGIIQRPPDHQGRVKVLLKLLSRQLNVDLRVQCIKGEWCAYRPLERRESNSHAA